MDQQELHKLTAAIDALVVFRGIRADSTVQAFCALLDRLAAKAHRKALLKAYSALTDRISELIEAGELPTGDPLTEHLISLVLFDDNMLARTLAREGRRGCADTLLRRAELEWQILKALWSLGMAGLQAMLYDHGLETLITMDWVAFGFEARYKPSQREAEVRGLLARSNSWPEVIAELESYWQHCGTGPFARYRAFRWVHDVQGGRLEPIAHPDPIRLDDIIGHGRERELLVTNTRHFLAGLPANNVLLYGDAGTGKSSLVKALLNEFAEQGLRLIEVAKEHLVDFPNIASRLRHRPEKFVVFVDDLSFEEQETQYKVLKAALEGTVEARPANVLVYATSNRRHLVRESFSDRFSEGDIHVRDSQQEKISLADRFGLHLTFVSPSQEGYLEIVEGLARRRGLTIEPEDLRRRALQWAQWQRGWSGRTARQFIDHLTAELTASGQVATDVGHNPRPKA